jgi:ribosomal protein S3AE
MMEEKKRREKKRKRDGRKRKRWFVMDAGDSWDDDCGCDEDENY